MSIKIIVLDRETLGPKTIVRRPAFDHVWIEHARTTLAQRAERLAEAPDIVITNKVALDRSVLAGAPSVRLIAVAATGTDRIDLEYCREAGVTVVNIRGYAVNTVPEHAFAMIFALRRSLFAYHEAVRAGRWQAAEQFCFFDFPIRDLAGCRLGIVGAGVLGQRVAEIGKALGMHPLFAARKGATATSPLHTPWEEMLTTSDIISLHAPLTPATRNMIAMPEFRAMERKPLLINTARGGLVNETDLVTALHEGLISGAGFDVATEEPPPADHPLMKITHLPNVIVTPHVAWASEEAAQSLSDQLTGLLESFVAGEPRNVVT